MRELLRRLLGRSGQAAPAGGIPVEAQAQPTGPPEDAGGEPDGLEPAPSCPLPPVGSADEGHEAEAVHVDGMIPTGITLYQWSHCPYCTKVRRAFDGMGLQYRIVEVGADQKEVYEMLGRRQVPAIRDAVTGAMMLESEDIIAYARRTYVGGQGVPQGIEQGVEGEA